MNGIIVKEVEDIQVSVGGEYPDFVDSYIESATFEEKELTDEELDWLTDEMDDEVSRLAYESFF